MEKICPKCGRPVAEGSTCSYCEPSSKKETGISTALLITFAIIMGIALMGYFGLKWIGNPFQSFQGYFSSERIYEVTKASPNLPVSRAPVESIRVEDIDNLHKLLKEKQFETLNTILEGYQKAYEADCKDEFKVYDAFRAFALSEPSYEEYFNQWIAATPDVYFPYLAAAEFYYTQAWNSRGAAWAAETTEAQFQGMHSNFENAEKHINTAWEIKPNLLCAFILRLGMQNASGLKEYEDRTFAQALKHCPETFLIRHQYLWCKLPRWGGSYEKMEACVKASEPFMQSNPRLSALYGRIYEDQANMLRKEKKYQQALELLNKGLKFGDNMNVYLEMAYIHHFDLKDEEQALDYAKRCILLRPVFMDGYLLRARIYYSRNEIQESLQDLQTARILSPGDPDIAQWKTWVVKDLVYKGHKFYKTDLAGAIQQYDTALAYDDRAVEALYWRGRAHCTLKDFDSAWADFKKAIEVDPRHFESCRMMDYLLAQKKDWDAVIGYWNAFLALEPNHAGAYLERAGTYRHKGDMENAVKDLKQSCDLGNQEACKISASLKN
ncbi:MAG: DUF4034 domain-containing protein [Desulfobacteraceae bacterium]|nr:MAG: DUF4034 domain-containing protein [Desulfobacteraceae bacterium]